MSESVAFQFWFCLFFYDGALSKKLQSLNCEICWLTNGICNPQGCGEDQMKGGCAQESL